MSFVHFLTVGRFGFTEESVPPGLVDRVVAHFVPGRLQSLGRPTSFLVPWNEGELAELEEAVKARYELELDLAEYLTQDGLLCFQYTGVEVHIAYPVAAVAGELFNASAGERGQVYEPEAVLRLAAEHAAENQRRREIKRSQDPRRRLGAVVEALEADEKSLPAWLAERYLAEVAPELVPELVELLDSGHKRLQRLACGVLREAGPAAAALAVPALAALLAKGPERVFAFSIAFTLSGLGPDAEPGLLAALDCEGAEDTALGALAKLESLSAATRKRLIEIAQGQGERADMAKHALGDSAVAQRLAAVRGALASLEPEAQSRVLAERLQRGELEEAQLRFAAYLGDEASKLVLEQANEEAPQGLVAWLTGLPEGRADWMTAVTVAALEARSATLRPRSAELTSEVAQTIRDGTASERFPELLDAHDWMRIPGLDLETLQRAVAASEASGDGQRQHLLGIMETLDYYDGRGAFFLFLRHEAVPRVLGP